MKDFKIRCSAISRIMSEPRSKADKEAGKLSETTKSYVKEWLTEQTYGVRKHIESKEIKKGLQMEDEAIDLLALHHDTFYTKNEQFFETKLITGTPDIITEDRIIDIKCPWDCFTFPAFEDSLPAVYYWQMQGYMYLTQKVKATVSYCLMNTPLELAYSEVDHQDWNETALDKRIKEFDVQRDDKSIDKILTRVEQIRSYLNDL